MDQLGLTSPQPYDSENEGEYSNKYDLNNKKVIALDDLNLADLIQSRETRKQAAATKKINKML